MLITLFLCVTISMSDLPLEAQVIAMCESGNTITLGTHDWSARSITSDGGAFQFNDATWQWLMSDTIYTRADYAPPTIQYEAFQKLWQNGAGWQHWKSSKHCWDEWFYITDDGIAIIRPEMRPHRTASKVGERHTPRQWSGRIITMSQKPF